MGHLVAFHYFVKCIFCDVTDFHGAVEIMAAAGRDDAIVVYSWIENMIAEW